MSDNEVLQQAISELRHAANTLREHTENPDNTYKKHFLDISLLAKDVEYLKASVQEIKALITDTMDKNAITQEEKMLLEKAVEYNKSDISQLKDQMVPIYENLELKEEKISKKFFVHKLMIGLSIAISMGAISFGDVSVLTKILGVF